MNEINYAQLAAECEAKAKAGVGPEILGYDCPTPIDARVTDSSKSLEYVTLELELTTNLDGVLFVRQHRMDSDGRLDEAGNLFLEALLRDATKPLHREAYEALQIIQCAASLDMDDTLHYVNGKFVLNCNDVFAWGCADCEEITVADLDAFKAACADSKHYNGALLFVARKRGMRPQGAFYSCIEADEWHLFDACGPARDADFGNPVATEKRQEYAAQKEQERVACSRGVVDALRSENQRLRTATTKAMNVFESYAEIHARKGTSDGDFKKWQNIKLATEMRAALFPEASNG